MLEQLKRRNLLQAFDFNGTYAYSRMLESQIRGENNSWAIRWYASAFLADKLTLYPGKSLIQNIGNDDSGTHCGTTSIFDVELSDTVIKLNGLRVEESELPRIAFEDFFKRKVLSHDHFFFKIFSSRLLNYFSKASSYLLPASLDRWLRKILIG